MPLTVLMCVGPADLDRLFLHSLRSCLDRVEGVGRVIVVSPDRREILVRLQRLGNVSATIDVREDAEVLTPSQLALPGWCRQQVIKLCGDRITGAEAFICLGADTVVLQPVRRSDLFQNGAPVLFYNRYPFECAHLEYERGRVDAVARLLDVEPVRSRELGDFIMDLMVFGSPILSALRERLESLHGADALARIMPSDAHSMITMQTIGEWTLYAVFVLDVLKLGVPVRNSNHRHLAQVHSQRELRQFGFDAKIVHFVSKSFSMAQLESLLSERGVTVPPVHP